MARFANSNHSEHIAGPEWRGESSNSVERRSLPEEGVRSTGAGSAPTFIVQSQSNAGAADERSNMPFVILSRDGARTPNPYVGHPERFPDSGSPTQDGGRAAASAAVSAQRSQSLPSVTPGASPDAGPSWPPAEGASTATGKPSVEERREQAKHLSRTATRIPNPEASPSLPTESPLEIGQFTEGVGKCQHKRQCQEKVCPYFRESKPEAPQT